MRKTLDEKLKMCEEHIKNGKSLSQISEEYEYDVSSIKYIVSLYKKCGEKFFRNKERRKYQRDTKLLAIGRVLAGESIRSVALDFELIDPAVLGDWVKMYRTKGESAIKDTYSRGNYLTKDERAKKIVDKALLEENERLKAEIEYLKKSQSLAQKLRGVTSKEKTIIVTELRNKFKLEVLLEIVGMASSVYYYNLKEINRKDKVDKYSKVKKEIDYLYVHKHKKRMGYQRIYIELKKLGYKIGKNKVLEIMRDKGYTKKKQKKWRKYNSYEGTVGWIQPNHMKQDFQTKRPYEKAGTDITMFPLDEESVYLSPIIDFNSREVLSYAAGTDAKMDKIKAMLNKLEAKHRSKIKGMMIQSDQGVQYQNSRYRLMINKLGMVQSMSRKGNCLDNSPTENFFGRMKEEIWNGQESNYKNSQELIDAIDEYIEYYNNVRIITKHEMTPVEYRNKCLDQSI